MSVSFTRPITISAFTVAQLEKLHKHSKICAKRLNLLGGLDRRIGFPLVFKRKDRNTMKGIDRARASASDEGLSALEQEAFMEGSTEFVGGRLEATLNGLSKWLLSALFAAIVLWRHDAEALWAAMGAVLNSMLSVTLKKILNQERPISTLRSDPGMPSSHAQSIFYTVTFLNLSMVEWYGINGLTATLSGLFFIIGSYFSWLRVLQRLHTVNQVIVGALIGSVVSILWYWSWDAFVLNAFVSYLWVRIVIVLGAIAFCLGFLYHIYQTWILEER